MAEEDAELLSCCEASHIHQKKKNHAQTCSVLISVAMTGRRNRHSFFFFFFLFFEYVVCTVARLATCIRVGGSCKTNKNCKNKNNMDTFQIEAVISVTENRTRDKFKTSGEVQMRGRTHP